MRVIALLVKGAQLVVDQSQLLRVRHLVLLLRVGLTRLFHALAAGHRVVFSRFVGFLVGTRRS